MNEKYYLYKVMRPDSVPSIINDYNNLKEILGAIVIAKNKKDIRNINMESIECRDKAYYKKEKGIGEDADRCVWKHYSEKGKLLEEYPIINYGGDRAWVRTGEVEDLIIERLAIITKISNNTKKYKRGNIYILELIYNID